VTKNNEQHNNTIDDNLTLVPISLKGIKNDQKQMTNIELQK